MRSPIKPSAEEFTCFRAVAAKIPKGSIVETFLFFSGEIEVNLSEADRFVVCRTTNYPIYEFWRCVKEDADKIAEISAHLYKTIFDEEKIFALLQAKWTTYKDPFMRASLFFLLNRCSSRGKISDGNFTPHNLNIFAINNLKKFDSQNLHLWYDEEVSFIESLDKIGESTEYIFIPARTYSRGLLSGKGSGSIEDTQFNHRKLNQKLLKMKTKWVLLYKFNPELLRLYKDCNITFLNKYGRETSNEKECEDLIIANF
tara:strand:+ start:878 stop:1648 length:771 start_codon:yes stop_codon:yes gene_type:complete